MSEASLSIQPFETTRCDFRAIVIPAALGDEDRRRFIARVREAVDQQVELAKRCETVLGVTGEVREENQRLIVPHEPCSTLNPQLLTQSEDRPDIDTLWWLTWSLARSLAAAEEMQITHGGVQAGSVYRNELGVVKLGDFGIATAFESACGVDARRHVACCPDLAAEGSARRASGVWALLDDDDPREYGWIAPYFGHELLEGRRRLNPKSDQFAMGTVLFLWASGTHPYGVELSDPNLLAYFQLEPFSCEDERRDWQDAFDNAASGLANKAQQSIVAWSGLVASLLSSEQGQRFKSLKEALKLVGEHANPDAWSDALERIAQAAASLDNGDVDAFLGHVQPLAADGALPAIWQTCLAEYVARAEADKEVIARRKALERRLNQGRAALDDQDMAEARTVADEVKAAPECDDALRDAADDLLGMCEAHEALVRSGAVELAKQNLEGAREALDQEDYQEAHRFCDLVLQDALVPAELRRQAEQLLTSVETAEADAVVGAQTLVHVIALVRDDKLPEARQALEQLLQKERQPESVAQQARLHLVDINQTLEKTERLTEQLDQVEQAIERMETDTADELLAEHPSRSIPKSLRPRRDALAQRRMNLTAALKRRHEAEQLFARKDPRGAAEIAASLSKQEWLPAALRDELAQFIEGCEQAARDADKAALERALASLEKAGRCLEELNVSRCRDLLEGSVLSCEQLESEPRRRAETLLESSRVAESALASLNAAREQLAADHFDEAKAALLQMPTEGLPSALTARAAELLSEIEEQRDRFIQEQRERLRAFVAEAGREIDKGDLEKADNLLNQVGAAAEVPGEIQRDVDGLREKLARLKPLVAVLDQAAQAVDQDALERAEKLLADAPSEPEWLARRAAEVRERLATARDRDHRAAVARGGQVLDAAEAALAGCDPQAALRQLESASAEIDLEKRLKERRDAVTAEAERIAEWLPRIQAASSALESGDVAETYRICKKHAEAEKPAPVAARLKEIQEQAAARIAARQAEIKDELSQLAAEIERRKARAARVPERTEAITSDALAAKVQKDQAAELLATFGAFPPPKSRAPAIAIATTVLAAAIGIYIWIPPITVQELLEDRESEVHVAARARYPRGYKPFKLDLNPRNVKSSDLVVVRLDGRDVYEKLCGIRDEEPDTANWKDPLLLQLFDPKILLEQLTQEANEKAEARYKQTRRDFKLFLELPDALDATLIAIIDPDGEPEELELGTLNQGREPDECVDVLVEKLAIPPPLQKLKDWKDEGWREARDRHGDDFRHFDLRFDRTDHLPARLIASLVGDPNETIDLGEVTGEAPPPGWRDKLMAFAKPEPTTEPPTKTLQDLMDDYVRELTRLLKDANARIARVDLTGDEDVQPLLAVAKYEKRELLSLPVRYDKAPSPRLLPDAKKAADHFLLQARALQALAAADRLPVTLPARFAEYEDKVRITQPDAAQLFKVDKAQKPQFVDLKSSAVLAGDNRANETFTVAITYSDDGKLTAEAADKEFTAYLRGLQQRRAPTAPPAEIGAEKVPDGLTVSAAELSPDGTTAAVDLLDTANAKIVQLHYSWDVAQLAYLLDDQRAARDIHDWLANHDVATAGWLALRQSPALSLDQGATGAGYFSTLEVSEATPSPTGVFSVATTLEIGPSGARPGDVGNLKVAARVSLTGGRPQLGVADPAKAGDDVMRQLKAKAADLDGFLNSRAAQAEAKAEADVGSPVTREKLEAGPPPVLTARTPDKKTRITWKWNNQEFIFFDPILTPITASPLTLLADLTGRNLLDDDDDLAGFVNALRAVTEAKCRRYDAGGRYGRVAALDPPAGDGGGAKPRERLLRISRRLQTLTGGTTGAFPLLFVEYYVENGQVFGLGWRTEAEAGDTIYKVVDIRIWHVDVSPPDADALLEYRDDCKSDRNLAASLLPMLPKNPEVSPGGAWGVIVAPDDFIWMTPWADLPIAGNIANLRFGSVKDNHPPMAVSYERLGDPLKSEPKRPGRRPLYPRVGIWCAPCLAGEQRQPRVFPPESPLTSYVFDKAGTGDNSFYVLQDKIMKGVRRSRDWTKLVSSSKADMPIGLHFWKTDFADQDGIMCFAIVQPKP